MTSKNHLGIGTCAAIVAVTGLNDLQQKLLTQNHKTVFTDHYSYFMTKLHLTDIPQHNFTTYTIIFMLAAITLYLIGCILPDIDTERSYISKLCRKSVIFAWLPLIFNSWRHHYWTHTCYFVLVVLPLGYLVPYMTLFVFLGLGYFVHLIVDSFGRKGVCWFIPNYIVYPNGGEVKKNHKIKLYRTNRTSEWVLSVIIYILTILWCIYRFML